MVCYCLGAVTVNALCSYVLSLALGVPEVVEEMIIGLLKSTTLEESRQITDFFSYANNLLTERERSLWENLRLRQIGRAHV